MRFLVDAQLPPVLAQALTDAGHPSWHIGEIAPLDSSDLDLCALARDRGAAIISKDADFVGLSGAMRPPLPVFWLRLGNCGNARLVAAVLAATAAAVAAFEAGETIVELR